MQRDFDVNVPFEAIPESVNPIRIFLRQPFTESNDNQRVIVQGVLDLLCELNEKPYPLEVLTGVLADSQYTFRNSFEIKTNLDFNPGIFRATRLNLLNSADVMIIVRTALSESTTFEIAYNIFGGRNVPMFFAVWQQAPIKTTLLLDLNELSCVKYVTFNNPEDLKMSLIDFFAFTRPFVKNKNKGKV